MALGCNCQSLKEINKQPMIEAAGVGEVNSNRVTSAIWGREKVTLALQALAFHGIPSLFYHFGCIQTSSKITKIKIKQIFFVDLFCQDSRKLVIFGTCTRQHACLNLWRCVCVLFFSKKGKLLRPEAMSGKQSILKQVDDMKAPCKFDRRFVCV